jgi:hypothetical protein
MHNNTGASGVRGAKLPQQASASDTIHHKPIGVPHARGQHTHRKRSATEQHQAVSDTFRHTDTAEAAPVPWLPSRAG